MVLSVVPGVADAQTTRFYNERGQNTYTARPAPDRAPGVNRWDLRDERGRNVGSIRNGQVYNERGQNVGTIRRDWRR